MKSTAKKGTTKNSILSKIKNIKVFDTMKSKFKSDYDKTVSECLKSDKLASANKSYKLARKNLYCSGLAIFGIGASIVGIRVAKAMILSSCNPLVLLVAGGLAAASYIGTLYFAAYSVDSFIQFRKDSNTAREELDEFRKSQGLKPLSEDSEKVKKLTKKENPTPAPADTSEPALAA